MKSQKCARFFVECRSNFTDDKQINVITVLIIVLCNNLEKAYITYVNFNNMNHFNYKYSVTTLDDSTTQIIFTRTFLRAGHFRLVYGFHRQASRVIR